MKEDDLKQFCDRMLAAAPGNMESIVLYGSAAGGDFIEERSDLNLLCVVRNAGARALQTMTEVIQWWTRSLGHRPPLVLTEEELRTSADVFAIETLDMKQQHRILAGRDVLGAMEVPMNLHRLQLEHELRTILFRLRQHYVLFADNDDKLKDALAKSVSSAVVMLRHAVIAAGQTPVWGTKREQVEHAAAALGVNVEPLLSAFDLREGRRVQGDMSKLYDSYMQVLSAVIEQVDKAAPKREWQRVKHGPGARERDPGANPSQL